MMSLRRYYNCFTKKLDTLTCYFLMTSGCRRKFLFVIRHNCHCKTSRLRKHFSGGATLTYRKIVEGCVIFTVQHRVELRGSCLKCWEIFINAINMTAYSSRYFV